MDFAAKTTLGLVLTGLLAGVAGAQTPASVPDAPAPAAAAPCVPADSSKTAAPGTKPCVTPSVSQQFPFPGEKPETPAAPDPANTGPVKDRFPYPGEAPAEKPKAGSAGAKFPYPGETKESPDAAPETPDFAPDPDEAAARKARGESGSGSSSSSSSSSGDDAAPGDNPAAKEDDEKPGLKDEGSEGSSRKRRLLHNRIPAQKVMTDDDRVEEDLSIAKFYQKTGNLTGAYLRVKDAAKVQPNDPDVHLALARVADKLGKKDEAVAEYEAYLKADPDTDEAKAARKALEKLKP